MGELHIAGPGLADSLPASEYRTGDLVSVTDDGALRYHGRADRQLKLGGVRIERGEIEQALRGHGAVAAAGVGVSRVGGRLRPVGFVVPVGDGVDQRELRVHLLASLPSVAVPNRIDELAELPTLPNGKLDHYALDELAQRAVARIPVPDEEP
jgi:acyl-coenzyme A synthetase/AMP-(fatty) acid ligase